MKKILHAPSGKHQVYPKKLENRISDDDLRVLNILEGLEQKKESPPECRKMTAEERKLEEFNKEFSEFPKVCFYDPENKPSEEDCKILSSLESPTHIVHYPPLDFEDSNSDEEFKGFEGPPEKYLEECLKMDSVLTKAKSAVSCIGLAKGTSLLDLRIAREMYRQCPEIFAVSTEKDMKRVEKLEDGLKKKVIDMCQKGVPITLENCCHLYEKLFVMKNYPVHFCVKKHFYGKNWKPPDSGCAIEIKVTKNGLESPVFITLGKEMKIDSYETNEETKSREKEISDDETENEDQESEIESLKDEEFCQLMEIDSYKCKDFQDNKNESDMNMEDENIVSEEVWSEEIVREAVDNKNVEDENIVSEEVWSEEIVREAVDNKNVEDEIIISEEVWSEEIVREAVDNKNVEDETIYEGNMDIENDRNDSEGNSDIEIVFFNENLNTSNISSHVQSEFLQVDSAHKYCGKSDNSLNKHSESLYCELIFKLDDDIEKYYGDVTGVARGHIWLSRKDVIDSKVHNHNNAEICGGLLGVISMILSNVCRVQDDRKSFTFIGPVEKVHNDEDLQDTIFSSDLNKALYMTWRREMPIRVVRSSTLSSPFAPNIGYRYDGLYTVVDWQVNDCDTEGFVVPIFTFQQLSPDHKGSKMHKKKQQVMTDPEPMYVLEQEVLIEAEKQTKLIPEKSRNTDDRLKQQDKTDKNQVLLHDAQKRNLSVAVKKLTDKEIEQYHHFSTK